MIYCTKPNICITVSSGKAVIHDEYSDKTHKLNETAMMILLLLETNDYDKAKSRYVELFEPASDFKDYLAVERLEKDFDDAVKELTEQKLLFAFDEADYDVPKITEFFRDYNHKCEDPGLSEQDIAVANIEMHYLQNKLKFPY